MSKAKTSLKRALEFVFEMKKLLKGRAGKKDKRNA